MVEIQGKLISLDVFEKHFICDIPACLGACCVHGDSGAPLEESEKAELEKAYPAVEPYLREAGKKAIKKHGVHMVDSDGDDVTPLIDGAECAYVVFKNGIAQCAIEKAYFDGKTDFRKPISCQLYPIRINEYVEYTAVNYHKWEICKPARVLGHAKGVPVYQFLKEAIIRKWDDEFYKELDLVYHELVKSGTING